jgi:hypothetical protein
MGIINTILKLIVVQKQTYLNMLGQSYAVEVRCGPEENEVVTDSSYKR